MLLSINHYQMSILIHHVGFRIKGVNCEGGFAMRHFMNRSVLLLIGIICIGSVAFTTLAQAETLVESNLLFRIYMAFNVDQAAAQAWLPDPWKAVSLPKGPFKGANLYLILDDRFLNQDAEGKPTSISLKPQAVRSRKSSSFSSMFIGVFSA